MSGLDERQRRALAQLVAAARSTLYDDAERALRGVYGIVPDGTLQPVEGLVPDPALHARRRTLEDVLRYLRADGATASGAVERLTRQVAFTHLNRLLAIRVADALGVLASSLRDGTDSAGFRQWVTDLAPLLATADDTGGYWTYLSQCADELAVDAPALFDPRNPLLALRPSKAAFEQVVALLADPANADLWDADDTFGWAYQFFNTKDERQQMRAASAAPRDSRELAVRNQFFTPAYVVRFLVHNTLGRRLVDADASTPLLDQLDLLVDPPTTKAAPVDLAQVKVLDPACGSGHFLLGCYDVLEAAWALRGVPPAEAAARIVPALWGIDIDPRAVQVAQAAVIFRARRACGRAALPPPNIVCARALPEDEVAWAHAEAGLSADLRHLVAEMRAALRDAPVLGPLLKAEQRLAVAIRSTIAGADDTGDDLFATAGIAHDNFGNAERALVAALQRAADATTATAAERLLAAHASDAVRFLEAVRSRYDVVLMNPPFGLAVPETEAYLKSAYALGWTDLYACFVFRALELLRADGYSGSITSNQYFTTRKLLGFRKQLVERHRPIVVVDLGAGVLHDAAVNVSCQILPNSRYSGQTLYADLARLIAADQAGAFDRGEVDFASVDLATFLNVDGVPFAFHVEVDRLGAWSESAARFEPAIGIVRTGGNTFDNFRFVRCRWEVETSKLGTEWVSYQKGGEFRPYWASSHLVVDWRNNGEQLRNFGHQRGVLPQVMQSSTHWRRPGLCYPRANKMLGVRLLPANEIFAEKSIAIFPAEDAILLPVLAFLNSSTALQLARTFGRSRFIENSAIKRLPVSREQISGLRDLDEDIAALVDIGRQQEALDETTALFRGFTVDYDRWADWISLARSEAAELQQRIDHAVATRLGVAVESGQAERLGAILDALVSTADASEWGQRLLSFLVGAAFRRWEVTTAAPGNSVFRLGWTKPLPAVPPGAGPAWDSADADAVQFILLDEPGSDRDIVAAVEAISGRIAAGGELLDRAVAEVGERTLRSYIRRRFFKEHLGRYSKSRRQAPVYWQLMVPSGQWSAWLYAPRFSREMLYALVTLADHRLALAGERIEALQRDDTTSARQRQKAVDAERTLATELQDLRGDIARLAGLGWQPDLDDGYVLCAAPLARWFPKNMWRQLGEQLAAIKKGAYPWAGVDGHRDEL